MGGSKFRKSSRGHRTQKTYHIRFRIGGIAEPQELLDFCGEHGITADVEVIKEVQDVNEAYKAADAEK